MNSKKEGRINIFNFFPFLTLIVICLFLVNRYLYIHRYDGGYMYTQAVNYNEFYFPEEKIHIQNLESLSNDSLRIDVAPTQPISDWKIKDTNGSFIEKSQKTPTLKLYNGKHRYVIYTTGKSCPDSIVIQIECHFRDAYTFISFCSLPMIENMLYPLSTWTKLPDNISEQEINETKKILRDSIGIGDTTTTLKTIIKIGTYLENKLRPVTGTPSDSIKSLTPLRQYQLACGRKDHVDCADYSDIYFLFANCAGIPTRRIGIAGWINGIGNSGHVLNESYVKEQNRWAVVDLTYKKILELTDKMEVLNTIDLLNNNSSGLISGIRSVIVDSLNHLDTVPYCRVNNSEIVYFKPTTQFYCINPDINNNMSFKDLFKEYLGEKSHFGIYYGGTFKIDNSKHYLALFIFKTSVAIFIFWLLVSIYQLFKLFKERRLK